jgi:type 1 glutamine amidotransferase
MTKIRMSFLFASVVLFATAIATAQNPAGQTPGAAPGRGRGRGPRTMKVLLAWADTRNGISQHDSTSHALSVIERLGYETGTYFTYIRTDSNIISYTPKMTTGDPASGGPSLALADGIFFMGHREIDLNADQKTALLKFVHDDGKGFVAAHVGSTAFLSWPEFGDMLGGRFDTHPWGVTDAPVIVEDQAFPGMKFFAPAVNMHEEFYQISGFSTEKSRVLMRLDTSNLDMAKKGVQTGDAPYPLTWAKMYGKGRVYYSSLGHDASTWDNPNIQRMWFEAIKWSLGLTDADITPRPASSGRPSAAPVQ